MYTYIYITIRCRNTVVLLHKIHFYKIKFIVYYNINNNLRNTNVTLRNPTSYF